MFFAIDKIEVGAFEVQENPKNSGNLMILTVFRTQSRTAFFTVNSKKAFAEFWDGSERKKIAKRFWSPQMKTFAAQKIAETPKPSFIFKFTIVGWIFNLLVIAFFGYLIYDSVKPPVAKPAEYVAMEQSPVEGDIYFGHFEIYKEKGTPIGAKIGYGWFKVSKVEGGSYYLSKSTQMSQVHKPKEELNSTDFESETMTSLKLMEQTGYNLRFKSEDGLTEVYITEKK